MNIWTNEAAADFFGNQHAAETKAEQDERKAKVKRVMEFIAEVKDYNTVQALAALLVLIEGEMK